jgi:hypothetical protein
MAEDIRWQQRFSNYRKALERLEDFLEPPALNEREQQGLIKAFETSNELAWTWMLMLQDRNLTRYTDCYLPCFQQLRSRLEQRVQEAAERRG